MNRLLEEHPLRGGQTLQLVQGDLTDEAVDAIVNAANQYLQHGGGLAYAIISRGGDAIQQESDKWVHAHGQVTHEQPAWTSGGRLAAKYVIHAVGPIWGDGDEDAKLAAAVRGSLRVADELKCASIALPAISTGIFGFPIRRAAKVITAAVLQYCAEGTSGLRLVKIVPYDSKAASEFLQVWEGLDWSASASG